MTLNRFEDDMLQQDGEELQADQYGDAACTLPARDALMPDQRVHTGVGNKEGGLV